MTCTVCGARTIAEPCNSCLKWSFDYKIQLAVDRKIILRSGRAIISERNGNQRRIVMVAAGKA